MKKRRKVSLVDRLFSMRPGDVIYESRKTPSIGATICNANGLTLDMFTFREVVIFPARLGKDENPVGERAARIERLDV